MSGLTDADRESVCICAELVAAVSDSLLMATCSLHADVVEAIVQRAVTAALTEAADAIEGRNAMYEPVGGAAEASRYARIVRAHIPT